MDIYLLRASLAEPGSDKPLYLSLEGRRLARAIGMKLKGTEHDRIVTSAAPTSVQTAELFAERTDFLGVVEMLPSLAPGIPAQIASAQLLLRGTSIVVVADEPELSALGAFLVGRPTFPPPHPAQISFIKDRKPEWFQRANEIARGPLLVA